MHTFCLNKNKDKDLSLAIGVFDGLHLGHSNVIKELINYDNNAVFTFNPHPRRGVKLILPFSERLRLLKSMGVQRVFAVNTKDHILGLSATEFIKSILINRLKVRNIIVGEDFKLGKNRDTDSALFKKLCNEHGINVKVIKDLNIDGKKLSSTNIRELIMKADLDAAIKMLGREYSIKGIVIKGKGIGRKLGFKTANIRPNKDIIIPSSGVYSTLTKIAGKNNKSVTFISAGPEVIIETHIPGIEPDLYGKKISVSFIKKIREIKRFGSEQELSAAIAQDIKDSV